MTQDWNDKIESAQKMLPLIAQLHNNNNVVVSVFGRLLINVTDIDIVKAHRYSRLATKTELSPADTLPVLEALHSINVGPASIDLGRLVELHRSKGGDLTQFLTEELSSV
ncbi:glyceraldehyde-3-phosphate dehydrogenase, partial [Corynebacterium diphtheriae]